MSTEFNKPIATDGLNEVPHAELHGAEIDAIKALEELDSEKLEIASKATGAEINTGTDDTKYVTSKSIADSKLSFTDGVETLINKTIDYNSNTIKNLVNGIVCIGDSITFGYPDMGYTHKLLLNLGVNWAVYNKGINGNTTSQMVARFSTDVLTNKNAKYVIIMGGINDINTDVPEATIKANLQTMYTNAKNSGLTVIALTITPEKGAGGWSAGRQTIIDNINTWILNTATDIDYKLDIYTLIEDTSNLDYILPAYNFDGLHPSQNGYNIIANYIYNNVTFTTSSNILDSVKKSINVAPLVLPQGIGTGYKITRTIDGSGNMDVSIVDIYGNSFSETNKGYIRIGNEIKEISYNITAHILAGTNYCNLGNESLCGKEQNLFIYVFIDKTNSRIGFVLSRICSATRISDFVYSSTAEKGIFGSGINDNPNDPVELIGRINVILSAGPNYVWSIPDNDEIINKPIFETREYDWSPQNWSSGFSNISGVTTAKYKLIGNTVFFQYTANNKIISGIPNCILQLLPFSASRVDFVFENNVVSNGINIGHILAQTEYVHSISIYKTDIGGLWSANETGVYIKINGSYQI